MQRMIRWGIAAACLLACGSALGQPSARTVFVANNGNLEGSVTSFRVNPDGTITVVQKFVIDSTTSTANPKPGTNAYGIDITPDGRFLAVSHATSASVSEQLTILRAHADGTMSLLAKFQTPDSPLDLLWISDTLLAVTRTNTSAPNQLIMYRFDPSAPSLVEIDREPTGVFSAYVARHPNRRFVYGGDSTGFALFPFEVQIDGTLNPVPPGPVPSGPYPLGFGVVTFTSGAARLYAGGGISSGGKAVTGWDIDPATGGLTALAGSPWTSPGSSPKQALGSVDGSYLFVAHGTDATIRVFAIDAGTGSLTNTGFSFDVGFQGSLGEMQVIDDLLFVTDRDTIDDGVRGLLPLRIGSNGQLTPIMARLDSNGSTPNQLVIWEPTCCVDYFADGEIDFTDVERFLAHLAAQIPGVCAPGADLNNDGEFDFSDVERFLGLYNAGC